MHLYKKKKKSVRKENPPYFFKKTVFLGPLSSFFHVQLKNFPFQSFRIRCIYH